MRTVKLAAVFAATALALVVRTTARIPVSETSAGTEAKAVVTSVPAWGLVLLALAASAVLAWLVVRYASAEPEAFLPLLVPGLSVAVFIPGLFQVAPFLAAFAGRFLDLVLTVSILMTLVRLGLASKFLFLATANRVAALGFCVFVALGWKIGDDVGLSGDEPHYILIAHSLWQDGDLRVENNYANEEHRSFYRGKIGPHLAQGSAYSVHGVGLALLLFPGYVLAGLRGVLVVEALLSALLLRELFRTASSLSESRGVALAATIGFGFTVPALFLSVSAYPELPAALAAVATMRCLISTRTPGRLEIAVLALAIGLLPLLHVKFIPLGVVLIAALGLDDGLRQRRRCLATAFVLGTLLFLSYVVLSTGSLDPTASYGRQRVFLGRIPLGVAGLLFDQEFGLLVASPFYAVGLVGVASLFRRRMGWGLFVAAAFAAVCLPGAAHPLWSGGSSPPARFVFPALPLLAAAAAVLWSEASGSTRRSHGWPLPLLVISFCLAGFTALLPGQPLYLNGRDGTSRLWEALSSSWDLTVYFPSLVVADARSILWAAVAALVLLVAIVVQASRRRVRLPPLALVLLMAAWAVDLSAPPRSQRLEARWVTSLWNRLVDLESRRFVRQPGSRVLRAPEVMEMVSLPLDSGDNEDQTGWTSRVVPIPAGAFRLQEHGVRHVSFCNGEGCFATNATSFESAFAMTSFHVRSEEYRAPGLSAPARLRMVRARPARAVALRSIVFTRGLRLHGLDDNAYLDPKGYWVRGGARARFGSEGLCPAPCSLRLSNGGVANWLRIATARGSERRQLRAWQQSIFELPDSSANDGVSLFSIESEQGFRPSELDSTSADNRRLGVFLDRPAF